jgi:hypothetical protein
MDFDNFDFDGFTLDNEGLKNDIALTPLELAIQGVVERVKRTADEMSCNLSYNERTDFKTNASILLNDVSLLFNLIDIDDKNLSGEEVEALIEETIKSTTNLTLGNMDDILGVENDQPEVDEEPDNGSQFDW